MPKVHEYAVYILECSDGSYYTGITNNVARRFREHQTGRNPGSYTSKRRPVRLVYTAHFQYVLDAIAWEKQVQRWSRKKKEALIRGDFDALPELAKKDFSRERIKRGMS